MSTPTPEATEQLPAWMAEHGPRPARVIRDRAGQPLRPWAGCRLAETRVPPPGKLRAPWEDWIVRDPIPHDAHVDNDGNTTCAGVEGIVAPTPSAVHLAELTRTQKYLADAQDRVRRAQRDVERLTDHADRLRRLADMAYTYEQDTGVSQ